VTYMRKIICFMLCSAVFTLYAQSKDTVCVQSIYLQEYIVQKAYEYIGTPYSYGDESKEGTDCSGLIYAVYKDVVGIAPERSVTGLYNSGRDVKGAPVPGDLVFFNTVGGISHVGIYIGDNKFIHAASQGSKTGVIISSLDEEYYKTRYLGAKRLLDYGAPVLKLQIPKDPSSAKLVAPIEAGIPLYVYIVGGREGTEFLTVLAKQADQVLFSKNVRSGPSSPYSMLWFTPTVGTWTLMIRDGQGHDLLTLQFTVEG